MNIKIEWNLHVLTKQLEQNKKASLGSQSLVYTPTKFVLYMNPSLVTKTLKLDGGREMLESQYPSRRQAV